MARILTTTRSLRARLVAGLALCALLVAPSSAPANSAIDQYDESIPNVDGSHQPSDGSSIGTAGAGGDDGSGSSNGGAGGAGSATAESGGTGSGNRLGDAADPAGLSASGDSEGAAGESSGEPGSALEAGVDSPPVPGWALAIAGLALVAAFVRAGLAFRSRARSTG